MKKFSCFICYAVLAVCLLLMSPAEVRAAEIVNSGTCGDNLTWTLDDTGLLMISGTGEMADYSRNKVAPWYSYRASLKMVIIEDGVTSIGKSAFRDCIGLDSVTVTDSVTSIGWDAFLDCNITKWIIAEGSRVVTGAMVANLSSLTEIVIPNSVISIGSSAFSGCSGLIYITLPDGATSIGECAFEGCSSLESITIPNGVTSIGEYAFCRCSSLESITIPNGVTSIGEYAFKNCTSLVSIIIPDSVIDIGKSAFAGCSSLESITIPFVGGSRKTANDTYQYPFGYIFGTSSYTGGVETRQFFCGTSSYSTMGEIYYIPASLKSVKVTDGEILYGAFRNCTSLTSITIPDGVTSIGRAAFQNCANLANFTIPDGVTNVGDYAFTNCTGLTSVTIPDSITSIGLAAFSGCDGLLGVYFSDVAAWCTIRFEDIGANPLTNAKNLYKNGALVTTLTIPDCITSIGNYTFYNCTSLTGVKIPEGVTSIGDYAFSGCISLENVTIPNSLTNIARNAFSCCTSLTAITIPDSVTEISLEAFSYCTSLISITIPDGVTWIGDYAFSNCTGLASVTIPGSVISIGEYAFYSCNCLDAVYYGGAQQQWNNISICAGNEPLTGATMHFERNCDNGHSYGNWTKVDDTTHMRVCSVCKEEETATHTWNSTVTKAATCKETGIETLTCTACSATKTETIAKLTTHTYDNACDPSCNICGGARTISHTPGAGATATTDQVCTICGIVLVPAISIPETIEPTQPEATPSEPSAEATAPATEVTEPTIPSTDMPTEAVEEQPKPDNNSVVFIAVIAVLGGIGIGSGAVLFILKKKR